MESFENALTAWQGLQLVQWQGSLAETLARLETENSEAAAGRQSLVKNTKEFKQLPESEQLQKFKDLLRLYQQEIDSLLMRLKMMQTTFVETVQPLRVAPDPLPLLQLLLEQADSTADLIMLRQDNADLREALSTSSKQIDELGTVARECQAMERRIAELEQSGKEQEELKIRLKDQLEESERKIATLSDRNEELAIELGRNNKAHETLLEQMKGLTEAKSQLENAKSAELEILMIDLESSRQRAIEIQRENDLLAGELALLKSKESNTDGDGQRVKEYEEQIKALQVQLEEIQRKAQQAIETKDRQLEDLESKLREMTKLEIASHELRILKAAEFPEATDAELSESLESILMRKNKRLETELVQSRNSCRELQQYLNTVAADLDESKSKIAELERIILKYEESSATLALSMNTSNNDAISVSSMGPTEAHPSSTDNSIIAVLTNQRDRLKRQTCDLEQRLAGALEQFERQKQESDRLQSDNIKLFERIKYLESFNSRKMTQKETIEVELGELLPHYQKAFEEHVDPFRLFFRNEIVQRFKSLGQTDRTVWRLGRIFLTNKFIRRFMMAYFALLHLFLLYLFLRSAPPSSSIISDSLSH